MIDLIILTFLNTVAASDIDTILGRAHDFGLIVLLLLIIIRRRRR